MKLTFRINFRNKSDLSAEKEVKTQHITELKTDVSELNRVKLGMEKDLEGSQPPSIGSLAPGSAITKPASNKASQLPRSFRSRPKSFDQSLNRQINIGAGRRERKNLKV